MKVGNNLFLFVNPNDPGMVSIAKPGREPAGMLHLDTAVAGQTVPNLPYMAVSRFDSADEARAYQNGIEDMGFDQIETMHAMDDNGEAYAVMVNFKEDLGIGEKPEVFDRRKHDPTPESPTMGA